MPNKTFFNLSASKRKNLIDIALKEFASQNYNSASVSRIVREAGIAQGSLYQYFANKKDLYLYLLDLLTKTKSSFLQNNRPLEAMDFFEYLGWIFETSLQFDITYPAFSRLAYRAFYGGVPFKDPVLDRAKQTSAEFMCQMVLEGIERGDIDDNLDPDLVVFVVETLSNGVTQYIPKKLGVSSKKLAEEGVDSLDTDLAKELFSDLIQILKFGLGNKSK